MTRSFALILFLIPLALFAKGKEERKAAKLVAEAKVKIRYYHYDQALPLLLSADTIRQEHAETNYLIGLCYTHSHYRENALPYFKKAKTHKFDSGELLNLDVNVHDELTSYNLNFNLAKAYQFHHNFEKAVEYYKLFIEELSKYKSREEDISKINHLIDQCNYGKGFLTSPDTTIIIKNLGTDINSEYPDYTPLLTADEKTLFFTSRRPGGTGDKYDLLDDNLPMEDIYVSQQDSNGRWSSPQLISENINTKTHEASLSVTPDGQALFFYNSSKAGEGNIFQSKLKGEEWTVSMKLGNGINTEHLEVSASVSPDGNELYFVSNRPGGKGLKDIYRATKNEKGEWDNPMNLGDVINTPYNEDAAYFHPDGSLYFSSQGHTSMGGYDVFVTTQNENGDWTTPINLGYPINTAFDELFFVWSADGKRAYFATHRDDSYGDRDIYVMHRPEHQESSVIVMKGVVKSKETNEPIEAVITIIDNKTGEQISHFQSNSSTGKYTLVLETGVDYGVTAKAKGYLTYSENIFIADTISFHEIEKDFLLEPLKKGSRVKLNNVFFDYDKAVLRPESHAELDIYKELINENPKLYLEIAGHTDSDGSESYNFDLSKRRSQAVINYFEKIGIDASRFLGVGYGESFPVATNETDEGKQLNRRTEIIVHEINGGIDKNWINKKGYYYAKMNGVME